MSGTQGSASRDYVRWGVLGNAMIARDFMIPELRGSELCRVTAIASRGALPDAFAPECRRYGSYEALLADSEIDAVYVPVPNALHAQWAIRAMQHGKHVLCEKPMACTAADGDAMRRAAEENGVLLMEAFMYRCGEKFRRMMQIVDSGVLGRIRSMQGTHGYPLTWKSPAREDAGLGGGCLYDVGCYVVDCMNAVMAAQGERLLQVGGSLGCRGGVDWNAACWLRYDGGTLGTLSSWFNAQQEQRMVLVGERGTLCVPMLFEPDAGELLLTLDGKTERIPVPGSACYRLEAEAMSRAILYGESLPIRLFETMQNLDALERLYAAAERYALTGEPVWPQTENP